jgi:DNA polymerase III gamma/tau subunit
MSLYLKYRPTTLTQIRGNSEVVASLEGMLADLTSCPHSFLLHGPTGCGKTTIARIIADRVGCQGSDYTEIDSADFRGIDTIRKVRNDSQYMAMQGAVRVWVVDECHKMTNDAQNALLKILEDTPAHIYFILCTTDPQKLIATIKGRCVQFQVLPISDEQMLALLRRIVHSEGEKVESEVLQQILSDSYGHPRNAIQILEQVLSVPPEQRLEIAKQSALVQSQSIELCRALIKRASWGAVAKILNGLKDQEPEDIRRAVLGYCQATLLKGGENDVAGLIMEEFMEPFYNSGFPNLVFACYSITKN